MLKCIMDDRSEDLSKQFLSLHNLIIVIFIFLYMVCTVYVMTLFVTSRTFNDVDSRITVNKMIEGTADRPFVYRIVVPKITGLIVKLSPEKFKDSIGNIFQNTRFANFLIGNFPGSSVIFNQTSSLYSRAALTVVMMCFIIGYILFQYKLTLALFPQYWATALFAPIVGLSIISSCTWPQLYIYDPAVLFFNAICYYFLAKQQWKRYFFWFFLAALNKETAIFIIMFYAVYFYFRLPSAKYLYYFFIQILLFTSVKLALNIIYMNNPGSVLENHYMLHVNSFLHYRYSIEDLITGFTMLLLCTFRWIRKPVFLRCMLVIVPVNYVAYFFYCLPGEYRDFFEVVPVISILIADTLVACSGIASEPVFNRSLAVKAD